MAATDEEREAARARLREVLHHLFVAAKLATEVKGATDPEVPSMPALSVLAVGPEPSRVLRRVVCNFEADSFLKDLAIAVDYDAPEPSAVDLALARFRGLTGM